MSELSPQAQAVDCAIADRIQLLGEIATSRQIAAAALRAAADQVVPEYKVTPGGSKIWPSEPLPSIRAQLLAIADELEAT